MGNFLKRKIIGERAPGDKMVALLVEKDINPKNLAPALRRQEGHKETYWIRCWVLVDDLGAVMSPVGMTIRRLRGQKCASHHLTMGKMQHFYELDQES